METVQSSIWKKIQTMQGAPGFGGLINITLTIPNHHYKQNSKEREISILFTNFVYEHLG